MTKKIGCGICLVFELIGMSYSALDWPQRGIWNQSHTPEKKSISNSFLEGVTIFLEQWKKLIILHFYPEKWFQMISFCFLDSCSKNWSLMGWLSFGLFVITYQDTLLQTFFKKRIAIQPWMLIYSPLAFGTYLVKKLTFWLKKTQNLCVDPFLAIMFDIFQKDEFL